MKLFDEKKEIRIGSYNFSLYAKSGATRYGFYHAADLYLNGVYYRTARVNYLNRTWECYRFQTVYKNAVYMELCAAEKAARDAFMKDHGYKRMTKKRLSEYDAEYASGRENNADYLSALRTLCAEL